MEENILDEKERQTQIEKWKKELGLTGKTTHYLWSLGIGDIVLMRGGWYSKDVEDVKTFLSKKIPVQWSTDLGGIVEIGFNSKAEKFVGVHYFHQGIIANPTFDNATDCLKWYMEQITKMEKLEDEYDESITEMSE